jgi:hypothetical protein
MKKDVYSVTTGRRIWRAYLKHFLAHIGRIDVDASVLFSRLRLVV